MTGIIKILSSTDASGSCLDPWLQPLIPGATPAMSHGNPMMGLFAIRAAALPHFTRHLATFSQSSTAARLGCEQYSALSLLPTNKVLA